MNNPTLQTHPHGRSRDEDLTILSAGGETGWRDDHGRPAPWPDDFLDPETGRATGTTTHDNNDPENRPY